VLGLEPVDLKPELVIADRFRLIRPLGEGGMGAVWLAHHNRLQIPCAVKFMRPEVAAEPAYRDRFDREAIAAAQIRSPHVVQILDHGVWEGAPYIAMEYLEGEDLAARLARRGRLSPEETVQILSQVARALAKAHAAGLVHRDLKPPNVFLVRDDDREIVKVLDFGIAKISGPGTGSQTKTGAIMGTPYYMSPEQAQGTKSVDHRTDLWALGVVAYQCLTGALPFVSEAFGDLVLKIIVEPIPIPSKIAPVPPGFDAWWARAVDRDPAARFQSAKEQVDALAEALGTHLATPAAPVTAVPETTSVPPPARPPSAGTMAAAMTSVAQAPRARSRAWIAVAGGLGAAAIAAFLAFGKGHPSQPPAAAAGPTTMPSAIATVPSPVETMASAAPSAAPAVDAAAPSAEPSASASAAASAAPRASASAAAKPLGKSARPATTAQPQGHDIGF
jgi:serine/threonine-protein kinase